MKTMKTSELIGPALDWAVMKCEYPQNDSVSFFNELRNRDVVYGDLRGGKHSTTGSFRYSERWDQAGPIIDREDITIRSWLNEDFKTAYMNVEGAEWYHGPTYLVAAMRAYVASKLGDEVEIPEELK